MNFFWVKIITLIVHGSFITKLNDFLINAAANSFRAPFRWAGEVQLLQGRQKSKMNEIQVITLWSQIINRLYLNSIHILINAYILLIPVNVAAVVKSAHTPCL